MTYTLSRRAQLTVTRLAGNIGGQVEGLAAWDDPAEEQVEWLRRAVLEHKVVFLRGQQLDRLSLARLAEQLGPITSTAPMLISVPDQERSEDPVRNEAAAADRWHEDASFIERPPALTLLHAVVVPPVGGDTIWANTVTAYESMPPPLRKLANGLRL